ncbi:GntR family transcriptional regulator [Fusibacter ferrireducens]|uniref:GntR family transcriptional regulator n=1 Tax=Fusibacter ferrireducens TaxID=2785058 RepID=A0ABR9ZXI9_9FIRM|nr:GntR family transcriptional regulator [Fusibacter ferrireducens]MBF4695174.1 GntR family transcriptional regulator [Fusibacter ferrireducens]
MKLDAENTIPLYQQLKDVIKNAIIEQSYKQGEKIPTEIELSERYGVSRITVRKAINELSEEGFLVKKQGKGTFVKSKKLYRKIEHLVSFSDACEENSMKPFAVVLSKQVVFLDKSTAESFNMPLGTKMIEIKRLRKADTVPIMLEINYFEYEKFQFLLEENLESSLYQLLEEKYNIVINATKDTYLDVIKADTKLSNLLEIGCGEPIFSVHAQVYDREDERVHFAKEYIVCERYRYALTDYYIDKSK